MALPQQQEVTKHGQVVVLIDMYGHDHCMTVRV